MHRQSAHCRHRTSRLQSYLFLLVNTLTWGAAAVIVKPAFITTTPFRFLLYRYILAVLLSLPLLWHYWPKIKQRVQQLKTIAVLELIGTTVALTLFYFGLDRTTAIEASLIATTMPLFVTVLGVLFLREKLEKRERYGLGLAFTGTILLTLLPIWHGDTAIDGISITGNMLIVGQNVVAATYFILAKKFYKQLPKLFVTTISFYVGLTTFFALSLLEAGGSWRELVAAIVVDIQSVPVWIASVYMALFGSIIGLTAYIKGQDGIEASEASLFWYLEPLVYFPLGIILLGERVFPLQLLSLAVILVGVVIAESRSRRK